MLFVRSYFRDWAAHDTTSCAFRPKQFVTGIMREFLRNPGMSGVFAVPFSECF